MSSKQLAQTVTHKSCRRPYTISPNWHYLTSTTRLYRAQAQYDGAILYLNDEIMIIMYDETEELKIYETPRFFHTSYGFATEIRYKREEGDFKKGDILYEYDCFIDGVPSYGHNIQSAFFPFFGINFEDCVVMSESCSNQLKYNKTQKILIPVYIHTLFKSIYPNSKHKFIPEIGQTIDKNIVSIIAEPKGKNKRSTLRAFNLCDFSSVVNNEINFNSNPIVSKLYDAKVYNIKVHVISKNQNLIDKSLKDRIEDIKNNYYKYVKNIAKDITSLLGTDYTTKILKNNYILNNPKNDLENINNLKELSYLIEIDLVKEDITRNGDKISNRYAGKGVTGLIIPDELRPYNTHTKKPIDLILGPLSIYSRMIFGSVLDGLLMKTVEHCEEEILHHKNANHTAEILNKLSNVSNILNNPTYSEEIRTLSHLMKSNHSVFNDFISSIENGGMYFEVPDFCKTDISKLQEYIKTEFNITTNDSITVKKELFEYIKNKYDFNVEVPSEDVVYPHIYNAPMYVLKLQQLASSKFSVRDVGGYSQASRQPTQDVYGQNKGSHLGSMEFDALIAHNNMNSIKEFHTVKSDCNRETKDNLVMQIVTKGEYEMPKYKAKSYTKMIIDSLMTFLNKN